jgi:hypothetical protein
LAPRQAVSVTLPIVEETDEDAIGLHVANGFIVTFFGEKYPSVERFRVNLDELVDPGGHPSTRLLITSEVSRNANVTLVGSAGSLV